MKVKKLEEMVKMPEKVTVDLQNNKIILKGERGSLQRVMSNPHILITKKDNEIILTAKKVNKRNKKTLGTFKAHLRNMIKGVSEGFTYRLKICSSHFPMNISVTNTEFILKNFLGEKIPRVLKLSPEVKVKVEGADVVVQGNNKEQVSQTSASIEKLTKIKNRDPRIFQDGIYIISKDGKEIK